MRAISIEHLEDSSGSKVGICKNIIKEMKESFLLLLDYGLPTKNR